MSASSVWATIRDGIRDLAGLAIGGFGAIHEELSGHPSPTVILIWSGLVAGTGGAAVYRLRRSQPEAEIVSTTPPSPPSPAPSSPSSS